MVATVCEMSIVETKANDVGHGAELLANASFLPRDFLVQVKLVQFVDCCVHLGRLAFFSAFRNAGLLICVAAFV